MFNVVLKLFYKRVYQNDTLHKNINLQIYIFFKYLRQGGYYKRGLKSVIS